MKSSELLLIIVFFLLYPLALAAEEAGKESPFSYNIRALVFADAQYPANSTQNPDNAFLKLYRYSGEFDLRPDFFWDQPSLSAVFKPRFTAARQWWEDGAPKGTADTSSKAFVNEWRVQAKPFEQLFLSFGKEKLLWGPSFLASPSNILFKDTEKLNPKSEVEGKYLAKAIIVPNNTLTVNVITETTDDENELGETLKPLQLVKADVLGSNYQVSVIGYERQNDRFRFGSYGQWTASDALLLYYDGIITKGTDAFYPIEDPANPLGGSFIKKYDDSGRLFTTVTAGGAYTFLSGATVNLEFLYNSQGYDDAEAAEYYRLRQSASDHFFDAGAISGLSQMTLNYSLNNGTSFLRRYYLMGQYQMREIKSVLDVYLRYVYGLEERAGQASTIIEWQVTDRVQFFNINTAAVGGGNTEFNSLLSKSFIAGIEVHF